MGTCICFNQIHIGHLHTRNQPNWSSRFFWDWLTNILTYFWGCKLKTNNLYIFLLVSVPMLFKSYLDKTWHTLVSRKPKERAIVKAEFSLKGVKKKKGWKIQIFQIFKNECKIKLQDIRKKFILPYLTTVWLLINLRSLQKSAAGRKSIVSIIFRNGT